MNKKMLIAVLAIALLVGTASAALLTYFGRITATVMVSQSVKLDGLGYPDSMGVLDEVSGVAGSQIHGDLHWLTNANPDKDAIVSLDSTIISGDSDGLTIVPKFRLDAVVGEDNDDLFVIPPTTTWGAFVSVSFDYFITEDSVYTNTPHVNIALRDPDTGEANCLIVSNEMPTSKDEWLTVTFTKEWIEANSFLAFGSIADTDVFNSISIEVADGSGVITTEQVQTVWVKNPTIRAGSGPIPLSWFRVPHYYEGCNVPALTVHFVMGYDFAMNAAAGERTVRTEVTYQGIYTQGFTWTP